MVYLGNIDFVGFYQVFADVLTADLLAIALISTSNIDFVGFSQVFADVLTADLLAIALISTSVVLYVVYAFLMTDASINFLEHLYTVVVLLIFGYATTPAIRTLTDTISTDTIFALSFITALISCVFHDYGVNAPM
ncbi:unnamed protein product [Strongylus vulgaris]|uniref:Uncharacterized protein n=1 Tax=Strongylus vulgaris TaxID=40348 RepID=A0A3P7L9G5_STRVU|nr:unnamed protein product [Strongylus vulgaris]